MTFEKEHLDFTLEKSRPEADPRRRLERFFQAGFEFVDLHFAEASVLFNSINYSGLIDC
jgi:hypothetical protein